MPKAVAPLSDLKLRAAKSKEKNYKLTDGKGLYLLVTKTGGKLWRFDYRLAGKRKTLALGRYPEISLTVARSKRAAAREQVARGVDPSEIVRAQKVAQGGDDDSFEVVAREWHRKYSGSWSPSHAKTTIERMERDVFKVIGSRSVNEIKPPELLAVLRRIESRGALETAHRVRTICGQVFRYAVATGRAEHDVTASLKRALPPYKASHLAAITDPAKVGELLRAIDSYTGSFVVKSALQLAPLVIVRPGELRQAEWSEIDLDAAEWLIPAERMKVKSQGDHLVPLSTQAVALLRELQPVTCSSSYVFPSHRSNARPMSNNAINAALRRLGYSKDEMTGHGFRAMARTILDEVLQVRPEYIEHQLAHAVRDANGRAYNRTSHLKDRCAMMQLWADYLDGLKVGAKVIPLKKHNQ